MYNRRMIESIVLVILIALSTVFKENIVAVSITAVLVLLLFAQFLRLIILKAPPFVPTGRTDVRRMVDLAGLRPGMRAYDLGCGDGRIVREAAKRGAVATGYELSVPTLLLAKLLTIGTPNASVRYGNFWKKDLRDADAVFCFLLKEPMRDFERKIWPTLKKGAKVVSYMFTMPGVQPVETKGRIAVYVK